MPDEITAGPQIPPPGEVLVPASDLVEIEGVHKALMSFAVSLGYLHFLLFGTPLVITSGRDGVHAAHSFHAEGRALDFRTQDKTDEEMTVFLTILAYAAPRQACGVFDERALGASAHIHLEYHGP